MLRNLEKTDNSILDLNDKTPTQNVPTVHIVLDINDTLATGFIEEIESLKRLPHLQRLMDENLFINSVFPYFLHPGAIELVQWIFQIPNVKVSFFSGYNEKRNTEFVKELLMRTHGDDFNKIKDTVSVYSKQHLISVKEEENKNQFKLFKTRYGVMKKDLNKILNVDNLDNVILVDDDQGYTTPGQEKNVLVIPGSNELHFYEFYTCPKQFPDYMGEEILSMNHIFYIAGMLSRIISMKNNSLADNLFGLQYRLNGEGTYELNRELYKDHQYYLDGLSALQKVNPKLTFYGGDLANEYFIKSNFTNKR